MKILEMKFIYNSATGDEAEDGVYTCVEGCGATYKSHTWARRHMVSVHGYKFLDVGSHRIYKS